MNGCDENKESLNFKYWDLSKFYGWEISQRLLVDCFEQVENTSQFNIGFIKSYNEDYDEGYFFEVDVQS